MKKIITRFSHPLRGIFYATSTDRNFRAQIYGVGALVALVMTIFQPLAASFPHAVLLADPHH